MSRHKVFHLFSIAVLLAVLICNISFAQLATYAIATVESLSVHGCSGCATLNPNGTIDNPEFSATPAHFQINGPPNRKVMVTFTLPSQMNCGTENGTLTYSTTSGLWSEQSSSFNPNVTNSFNTGASGQINLYLGVHFCIPESLACPHCSASIELSVFSHQDSVTINTISSLSLLCNTCDSTGSIHGSKYFDSNCDGKWDSTETALGNWVIYLDANNNAALDGGETSTTTASDGSYSFNNLLPGTYHVREVQQPGWSQSTPVLGSYTIVVSANGNYADINFGNCRMICLVDSTCYTFRKPTYTDTSWTRHFVANDEVMVTTVEGDPSDNPLDPQLVPVLGIINMRNKATFPAGTVPSTQPSMFFGPASARWDKTLLGSIFGLTLDDKGNIFTAATSIYAGDVWGTGGDGGSIYRVNTNTAGTVTRFTSIPNAGNPSNPGLGNICFNYNNGQLYVTNFGDGGIYRLTTSGVLVGSPYYPNLVGFGTASAGYVQLGKRLWGIKIHANRLYYSVWNEDGPRSASPYQANTIRSVALDGAGACMPTTDRLEVTIPPLQGLTYSNPVADISFSLDGKMLLGERTVYGDDASGAHASRVLEYICCNGEWEPSANIFDIGQYGNHTNAAGGVAYSTDGQVGATADALHYPSPFIYGVQLSPPTGGTGYTSKLIDLWGNTTTVSKTMMGDVEFAKNYSNGHGSICGRKWFDRNRNGIFDPKTEYGIRNWKISLVACDENGKPTRDTIATVLTDNNGYYCFKDLCAGCYYVFEEHRRGWAQTWPVRPGYYHVDLGTNQNALGYDFGNFRYRIAPHIGTSTDTGSLVLDSLDVINTTHWPITIAKLNPYQLYFEGFFGIGDSLPQFPAGQYSIRRKQLSNFSFFGAFVNGISVDDPTADSVIVDISADTTEGVTINFFNLEMPDTTVKFRTFTATQLGLSTQAKPVKRSRTSMPNTANMIDEILKQSKGSIVVGLPGQIFAGKLTKAYLVPGKQADVYTTFVDRNTRHEETAHGLDFYKNSDKRVIKKMAYLSPRKHNNTFLANLLALKVNIAASNLSKIPAGLSSLMVKTCWCDDQGSSVLSVARIASKADSMITNWEGISSDSFQTMNTLIEHINSAFADSLPFTGADTLSWITGSKLRLSGAVSLSSVPYFQQVTGFGQTQMELQTSIDEDIPIEFDLMQNYPNPFNPTTTIQFNLPEASTVTLKVFNMLGQEVGILFDHENLSAGTREVEFDASQLTSGVYFYRLVAEPAKNNMDDNTGLSTFVAVKKLILVK